MSVTFFLILVLKLSILLFPPRHPVYYSLDENFIETLQRLFELYVTYSHEMFFFVEIFRLPVCVWKIKYLR